VISYAPFRSLLDSRGIRRVDIMRDCAMSPSTYNKLRTDQTVNLDVIDRVCVYLDAPIEDVVEIIR
jgi:DNA-binding Xre family transcriptional regulator